MVMNNIKVAQTVSQYSR